MTLRFETHLTETLDDIKASGLYKTERPLLSSQAGRISVSSQQANRDGVINLCANNYLGLANHPELLSAAKSALDDFGFGMASVRFICGTREVHKTLEHRLARC